MFHFLQRLCAWGKASCLACLIALLPKVWADFELQQNWGFEQGGGYRQGDFIGEDGGLVLTNMVWDEQNNRLAVGGALGNEWAVRVYEVGSNGPNLVAGWTGALEPKLEFSTITALAWSNVNNSLICGVEHLADGRMKAGLLTLNVADENATQFTELENWESVAVVEKSVSSTDSLWVLGEGNGRGLCRKVNAFDPGNSLVDEFMLDQILRPQGMCEMDNVLWVAGKAGGKKSFLEIYEGNKLLGRPFQFNDDHFISSITSDGSLVYLTGRERMGNKDEMENFFLDAFELKNGRTKRTWSAKSESFKQDGGTGRAEMGREVGTNLMPLPEGGVLVAGYHQQYWKLGKTVSGKLAMLPPDKDGNNNFEGFIAQFDQEGNLLWAQPSGFRGNDFPLSLIKSGLDHAVLLGNRKMSRGLGPYLEKVKITGQVDKSAPLVEMSAQALNRLSNILWEPQSTLRFGESIDSRHLSATAPGGANFVYELNGTSIEEGDFLMFIPGQIELTARLLSANGEELNATLQSVKGLKGRPYLKLSFQQLEEGIQFSTLLTNLHPEHLAQDSGLHEELMNSVSVQIVGEGLHQIDEEGILRFSPDFTGKLEVEASFPEHTFYEAASSRLFIHIRNGQLTQPGDENMLSVKIRDLDGWQKEKRVSQGTEVFVAAVQGFGKNRKFNKWVEFSEEDQKLRTARVQSPFNIRTAILAQEDMTLFAHYNFTFVGTAINGYLGGSTVFLDFNLNGRLDEEEPTGFTTTNGGYEIEISEEEMQAKDKNANGQLDPDEAMVVVIGGMDHSSKVPLAISYRAPPSYSVITAVSTMVAEFLEEGLSLTEAEEVVSSFLALPEGIHFPTFEPLREILNDGEKAKDFILKSTQLANLFNEGSRFLQVKLGNRINRIKGAELIVSAVTNRILEQASRRSIGDSFLDLNDPDLLVSIISAAEELSNTGVEDDVSETTDSSDVSLRAELTEEQPEIAEAGNEDLLNELIEQIASANQVLEELSEEPDASPTEFKALASATQITLNELGDHSTNVISEEEVEQLDDVSGEGAAVALDLIERAEEVESLDSGEGNSTADHFNLAALQEVSAENQINVYAPVLTINEIITPPELNQELIIGSFSAYDPEGDNVSYEIIGLNPDHDLDEVPLLSIDPESGQVSILDLDDLPLVEDDMIYPIIRVSDANGLFRDEEVTIDMSSWADLGGRLHIPDLALKVPENLPVGTVIHTFATDDVYGGKVEYQLISGAGDTNNDLFSVDAEGNLQTLVVFDYETDPHDMEFRLQAMDSSLDAVEKSLEIKVSDIVLPNVQTGSVSVVDSQLQFEASMSLFENAGDDLKLGFLIGHQPIIDESNTVLEKVFSSSNTQTSFVSSISSATRSGTFFYKAFAENSEGINYGLENSFVLPRITAGEDWVDGKQVGEYSDWWQSDWFGMYFTQSYPWIYHEKLGWVYIYSDSSNGAWIYHPRVDWMWTTPELYSFLYLNKRSQWSRLNLTAPRTTLFDYELEEWFEPDTPIGVLSVGATSVGGEVEGYGYYYRWDKVKLIAKPSTGFNFAGWSGDMFSLNPEIEFEAIKDTKIGASFIRIPSSNSSSQEVMQSAMDALNKMDHLNEEQKKKSLAELLIYGSSPTSGLKFK